MVKEDLDVKISLRFNTEEWNGLRELKKMLNTNMDSVAIKQAIVLSKNVLHTCFNKDFKMTLTKRKAHEKD